jgi:tRNA nucleotidyltransferase (CCA-adding enzyme)
MNINMPYGASYIIKELNKHGFEAYIVGGCVRDSLLGKAPNDWDITTDAKPEQVKEIFTRTVDTGIQHGTVTVLVYPPDSTHEDGNAKLETYEVTTYRVDGEYADHRRPKEVSFTASLEEDLKRRDFTINAMAYNDESGLVDIFGGAEDLDKGIIHCVGNPDDRFDEDALRILRAVRFSAQLDFRIDEATEKAITGHAGYLKDISAERIQVELTKLITSDNPGRLADAYRLGLTKVILPEFDLMMETEQKNPYHLYTVGMHTIKVMENIPASAVLRYTALLHDSGKPGCKVTGEDGIDHFYGHPDVSEKIARKVLRRLKLDNNTVKQVCLLVKYHDFGTAMEITPKNFRKFLSNLGMDNFDGYMAIKRADMAGQSEYKIDHKKEQLEQLENLYAEVKEKSQGLYIKDLAIGGKDLMAMGIEPGKPMGDILSELLDQVIDDPEKNTVEYLTAEVHKLKNTNHCQRPAGNDN